MDHASSQESEIMNEGDLEYIMGDLRRGPQFMFLQGHEYVDEFCNAPTAGHGQENGGVAVLTNQQQAPEPKMLVMSSTDAVGDRGRDAHSPTGTLPCLTKYAGVYDFQVDIAGTHNSRHAWVFSTKLQKIYIDMDKVLLFQFKLNTPLVHGLGLRVRALLVYTIPDHSAHPVERCTFHFFKCDPNHQAHPEEKMCMCVENGLAGHVLTVVDHPTAEYEYDACSGRHSVCVPLSQPHAGDIACPTVAYQFKCKTSCPGGMSRRPVALVFTLETHTREVLGRHVIAVKVCSCPKRDKDREESGEFPAADAALDCNEQLQQQNTAAKPSKRKMQLKASDDTTMGAAKALKVEVPSQAPPGIRVHHGPSFSALVEEVHHLNRKMEQMQSRIDEIHYYLQELVPRLSHLTNANNFG